MRDWRRRFARIVALAWVLFGVALPVRAQEARCGHAGRPWVALVFVGDQWPAAARDAVGADLRAGLRLRGIDVCALGAEGSEPPLAMVQLSSASPDHVSVSIEVHDAITEKRVLRDIDLRNVTSDGRGLTVAQAAEELLRASWAELALEDHPEPMVTPPPEVRRAVEPHRAAVPVYAAREIGARAAFEHHGGGATLLGGDAFFLMWLGSRVGAEAAIGLRQGLRTDTDHGSVDIGALVGSLDVVIAVVPREPSYDLMAKLGAEVLRTRLSGRADALTNRAADTVLALSARGSLGVNARLSQVLRVGLEIGGGVPLQAALATQAGEPVVGTTGFEVHATFGTGVAF